MLKVIHDASIRLEILDTHLHSPRPLPQFKISQFQKIGNDAIQIKSFFQEKLPFYPLTKPPI